MADQKLTEYIKLALSKGKSKEEIYKDLLSRGLKIEDIQENFNFITSGIEKEDTQKKTINTVLVIGAVLVGAGIFSFIASNWQGMTKPVKISVIIIAMLSSYSLGWYLKEKLQFIKSGDALILLGSIIYGAGIFLVAQMFNIRANWLDGLILWMLGTIAAAFAAGSYPLFYLAILLGVITVAGSPFGILSTTLSSLHLTSSVLLFTATVVTFITGWLVRKNMPENLKDYH